MVPNPRRQVASFAKARKTVVGIGVDADRDSVTCAREVLAVFVMGVTLDDEGPLIEGEIFLYWRVTRWERHAAAYRLIFLH